MRLRRCPTKCTRKIVAGDARRVPARDLSILSGYYLGCPGCGRAVSVSATATAMREAGMDVGETPELTVAPTACDRCGVRFRVDRDEVVTLGP